MPSSVVSAGFQSLVSTSSTSIDVPGWAGIGVAMSARSSTSGHPSMSIRAPAAWPAPRPVSSMQLPNGASQRPSRSGCPSGASSSGSNRRGQDPDRARRLAVAMARPADELATTMRKSPSRSVGNPARSTIPAPRHLTERHVDRFPVVEVSDRHRADTSVMGLGVLVDHDAQLGQAVAMPHVHARKR